MNPILRLWLPVAAWCAVIFGFSSIPDLQSGLEFDFSLRKLAHVAEYAILFRLWLRAHRGTWGEPRARLWTAFFCLLYAASDEWHQNFVPNRSGRVVDVAIDGAGVLLAAAFARVSWPGRTAPPTSARP